MGLCLRQKYCRSGSPHTSEEGLSEEDLVPVAPEVQAVLAAQLAPVNLLAPDFLVNLYPPLVRLVQ
jgi:hypothetical protein